MKAFHKDHVLACPKQHAVSKICYGDKAFTSDGLYIYIYIYINIVFYWTKVLQLCSRFMFCLQNIQYADTFIRYVITYDIYR